MYHLFLSVMSDEIYFVADTEVDINHLVLSLDPLLRNADIGGVSGHLLMLLEVCRATY